MLMRLKGIPPDAFIPLACEQDYCRKVTVHGMASQLKWVTGPREGTLTPNVECQHCGMIYRQVAFEVEPIEEH